MENPTKYYSDLQEKTIAKALGWKQVSGSGARAAHPGDIESTDWLGECKTHTKPGHSIKFDRKVWQKIQDEAAAKFRVPVLFVDDGSQKLENTWCMYPSSILPDNLLELSTIEFPECFIRKNINFPSDELHNYISNSDVGVRYHVCKVDKFYGYGDCCIASFKIFKEMFAMR